MDITNDIISWVSINHLNCSYNKKDMLITHLFLRWYRQYCVCW